MMPGTIESPTANSLSRFKPRDLLIADVIELNARSRPNNVAFFDHDRRISWSEFGRGTAKASNALLALGLQQGDRVVVWMNNSYEMAEAMFGIVRASLVAVPLNVSVNDSALAGMLNNCSARAVIASQHHVQRINDQIGELMRLT